MPVNVTLLKERGVLVLAPTDKERQISPHENFPPCESRLSVFWHCVPCRSLTFALFHATVGNFSGEFQAGLSRSHLEGERTRKLAFHFRRKTEQQRVLPSLRENSRWEVFSPNEASSSPGGLGDKTEEVVWGFFRKRALMTKEISAEFSRFSSKFAAGRRAEEQLITWWFAHQASRGNTMECGKSLDVTRGSSNRENDNLLLWPFKCLLLPVISPFIETGGVWHIVAWVMLPPRAPSFQVVLRISVHVLTCSSICSRQIWNLKLGWLLRVSPVFILRECGSQYAAHLKHKSLLAGRIFVGRFVLSDSKWATCIVYFSWQGTSWAHSRRWEWNVHELVATFSIHLSPIHIFDLCPFIFLRHLPIKMCVLWNFGQ